MRRFAGIGSGDSPLVKAIFENTAIAQREALAESLLFEFGCDDGVEGDAAVKAEIHAEEEALHNADEVRGILAVLFGAVAAVQYRSEAFHGEVLVFDMAADDFNKYGCDLVWRITEKASAPPPPPQVRFLVA